MRSDDIGEDWPTANDIAVSCGVPVAKVVKWAVELGYCGEFTRLGCVKLKKATHGKYYTYTFSPEAAETLTEKLKSPPSPRPRRPAYWWQNPEKVVEIALNEVQQNRPLSPPRCVTYVLFGDKVPECLGKKYPL